MEGLGYLTALVFCQSKQPSQNALLNIEGRITSQRVAGINGLNLCCLYFNITKRCNKSCVGGKYSGAPLCGQPLNTDSRK